MVMKNFFLNLGPIPSAQLVLLQAVPTAAQRPGSACGGRESCRCDQQTVTRSPTQPTRHTLEKALHTGVLGSVCAGWRSEALPGMEPQEA